MAVICPYCFQVNPSGTMRCMYCRRYIDREKKEIDESELLSEEAFDYKKGIRLDMVSRKDKDLTDQEFISIVKVVGIVVLMVSFFILLLKALF